MYIWYTPTGVRYSPGPSWGLVSKPYTGPQILVSASEWMVPGTVDPSED